MNEVNDHLVKQFILYLVLFAFLLVYKLSDFGMLNKTKSFLDFREYKPPYHVIDKFKHYNGTLLSPQGQDERWSDFTAYFIKFQEELSHRSVRRYVVYSTTNSGLANKINGLLSSLLVAMVSNRGLQCMVFAWSYLVV